MCKYFISISFFIIKFNYISFELMVKKRHLHYVEIIWIPNLNNWFDTLEKLYVINKYILL